MSKFSQHNVVLTPKMKRSLLVDIASKIKNVDGCAKTDYIKGKQSCVINDVDNYTKAEGEIKKQKELKMNDKYFAKWKDSYDSLYKIAQGLKRSKDVRKVTTCETVLQITTKITSVFKTSNPETLTNIRVKSASLSSIKKEDLEYCNMYEFVQELESTLIEYDNEYKNSLNEDTENSSKLSEMKNNLYKSVSTFVSAIKTAEKAGEDLEFIALIDAIFLEVGTGKTISDTHRKNKKNGKDGEGKDNTSNN
ncbi:MAG: hypothetical protein MJ211_13990 [Bacteroidales bacterium]|nr:hypothetical protein [Bacteroidales bacterium]